MFMRMGVLKTTLTVRLKRILKNQDIVLMDRGQPFALMVKTSAKAFEKDLDNLRQARFTAALSASVAAAKGKIGSGVKSGPGVA